MVKVVLIVLVYILAKVRGGEEECGILKNENDPPWNVGIYREIKNNNLLELVCLGTAVKHNVILTGNVSLNFSDTSIDFTRVHAFITAAHCLCDQSGKVKSEEFYISSRKLDRHTKHNGNMHRIEKKNIFIHGAYKGEAKNGDLAVIKLQNNLRNVDYTPICIDWDNTRPTLEEGEKLRHPAWKNGNLRMTDVSYTDYEQCYYLASDFFKTLLTSDKICAKSGKDNKGDIDEGAGLIYLNYIDNLWYLRGVVSTHDPEKNNVISYSHVILYLNWLSSIFVRL